MAVKTASISILFNIKIEKINAIKKNIFIKSDTKNLNISSSVRKLNTENKSKTKEIKKSE